MQLVNVLLAAASVVAIHEAARRTFGRPAALWAALALACYPPLIYMVTRIQSVNWSVAWLMIALALMTSAARRSTATKALLTGAAVGAGALGEPILLAPFGLYWLERLAALLVGRPVPWRHLLLSAAMAAVVLLPWTLRNAAVHGRAMAVKSTFWYVFWQGNNPRASGVDKLEPSAVVQRKLAWRWGLRGLEEDLRAARSQAVSVDSTLPAEDLRAIHKLPTEAAKVEWFRRESRRMLSDDPARYARLCLKRLAVTLWFDPTNPRAYVLPYRLPYLALAAAAIAGCVLSLRSRTARLRSRRSRLPWLMFLGLLAVFALVITSARFRLLLEALLLLPAGYAAAVLFARAATARRNRHVWPAALARRGRWVVLGAATFVAVVSARPYAGSWNDGASLAAVECVVDYGTLAIDRSVFVEPARRDASAAAPYPTDDALLMNRGTLDKVFVDGRYYAAKPFVPSLLMAGEYKALQSLRGLTARRSPAAFIFWMTLLSSGLAYVVAVCCVYELSRRVLGSPPAALAMAASFGLGSLALPYARHVNGHLPQLAAAAALLLALHAFAERVRGGRKPWGLAAAVGTFGGLAYVFDQGTGPALWACLLPLLVFRCRRLGWSGAALMAVVLAAASPWIVGQHLLNLRVGHTIWAINSVPAHFDWPGSPWNAATMSGVYSHEGATELASYAGQMLVGKKGFLLHSPVMLAAVAAWAGLLLRRRSREPERPELWFGFAWAVSTWLLYAWGSNNYSGRCASVRWFLPLLAPGYHAAAVLLRERPRQWGEFRLVAAAGCVLAGIMWWHGPWIARTVPGYWFILVGLLLIWLAHVRRDVRRGAEDVSGERAIAAGSAS
jgi:4-amino-4-deoxy-L-arabinose transferase-like glycosyltransferase